MRVEYVRGVLLSHEVSSQSEFPMSCRLLVSPKLFSAPCLLRRRSVPDTHSTEELIDISYTYEVHWRLLGGIPSQINVKSYKFKKKCSYYPQSIHKLAWTQSFACIYSLNGKALLQKERIKYIYSDPYWVFAIQLSLGFVFVFLNLSNSDDEFSGNK